jgi:dimethylargininase
VTVNGCLHLKSAVTQVAADTLLVNRDWLDVSAFGDLRLIDVDPEEPTAANALRIGEAVIYAAAYPRTRERLEEAGIVVHTVDVSELAKAEGAVTCCSLILTQPPNLPTFQTLGDGHDGG